MHHKQSVKLLLRQPKTAIVLVLAAFDALFFSLTNPANVASPLLIVGFLLLVTTLYWVLYAVMTFLGFYGLAVSKHRYRFAAAGTGLLGMLCALQSVNQLSAHDVFVLVPLAAGVYLYVTYGHTTPAR